MKRFICSVVLVLALVATTAPAAVATPASGGPCILGYAWC